MYFYNLSKVAGMILSTDGGRLATIAAEDVVAIWETRGMRRFGIRQMPGVRGVSFSADHSMVAVVQEKDGYFVSVLSARLGRVLGQFDIPSPSHPVPAFNADATVLGVGQSFVSIVDKLPVASKGEFTGHIVFHPSLGKREYFASLGSHEIITASYWSDETSSSKIGPSIPPGNFAMEETYRKGGVAVAHPIEVIAYNPSGNHVAIGYPNLVVMASADTLDFRPGTIDLVEIFGNHYLVRNDVTKVAFSKNGYLAIAVNVCRSQVDKDKPDMQSGVLIYDVHGRRPKFIWEMHRPAEEAIFCDVAFNRSTSNDLMIAGIDLSKDAKPFLLSRHF